MQNFSRRDFLKLSVAALAVSSVSVAVTGCAAGADPSRLNRVNFSHGVASGDATQSSFILWTRALPELAEIVQVTLSWQLALDADFQQVVRSGEVSTSVERDFTVKVDVQELPPGTKFFYRFVGLDSQSMIGKTKTLSSDTLSSLKLAVFSCSNYPAGFFNVYREAATQQDLDAVIHLGDYIYEYAADGYATEKSKEIGRTFAPDNASEILSLKDYRNRYALYRSDEALQQLHAAFPWYLVWDDHEITNDTWHSGAENHQPDTEGDFLVRRMAAVRAYYEWLPIRPPQGENSPKIYRSFNFGTLLSLHLLDTRVIARDEQLDYKNYVDPKTGQFDAARFSNDLTAERSLLGQEQLNWLQQKLQQSKSHWQLLGQQLLMSKMHIPAELLSVQDYSQLPEKLQALVEVKKRVLAAQQATNTVNPTDVSRVNTLMPYNLDAWDGYPKEREQLYAIAKQLEKRLVVIAGDTHNAWCSQLVDQHGAHIGIEFATPSVSSPGLEYYLKVSPDRTKPLADAFSLLIPDLQWCNLHQRGYMQLSVTRESITCEWRFIDNILSTDYQVVGTHQVSYPNHR